MFVLSFYVNPYFQLEKNLSFFYLLTITCRRHKIPLVYYHLEIIVMKLVKIKLIAKIGQEVTQTN